MKPNAIYQCWMCEEIFESEFNKSENRYEHPIACPYCNNKYFTWVNYKELFPK